MTVWHDVDERVLLWVADDLPASMEFEMVELPNDDEPCERVEGLTNRQVIQALQRLESYGLVAFAREPAGANIIFTATRLTALGHQVLNEWPDLDQIDAVQGVSLALAAMAEKEAQPEKASLLRRAAGILLEIPPSILVNEVEKEAGKLAHDERPPEPRKNA